ncbi:hypothetical protein EVAR_11066_1 [Eumeta japonica]|uniref:Uncharacterized protein n=1 Tax=Eumeta variegata TaxID=151549 RepID=A0A4C1U3S0_EUMVA|nr:hypothetical protein EVAR_11066_1 [Eumeta japonica]
MAALTGPSAEPSLDDSAPRVPSQLANIPNVGFLNNGYRNFRLAASTSSSVVANLLRCKLDCINRRDTRSVHPSVDDPRPYVCGLQPGRLLLAVRHLRPNHIIPFCSDPALRAECPMCGVLAASLCAIYAFWGLSILSGPACYASVLPAAVRAPLGHFFVKTFAMSVSETARTLHQRDWSHTGRLWSPTYTKPAFIRR